MATYGNFSPKKNQQILQQVPIGGSQHIYKDA
jgi:hypothetical protein